MAEHTTAKLAAALQEIPGMPRDMIKRAVDGYYHDFLSPLAMPEMQLVADLRELAAQPTTGPKARTALEAMAQRVIGGDFDATKEESDAWAASPEGQETFRQLRDDARFSGIVRHMEGVSRAAKTRAIRDAMVRRVRETARPRRVLRPVPGGAA